MPGAFGQPTPEPDGDPFEHPSFKAYAARVRRDLIPKLEASAATIGIYSGGEPDVKQAVEIGFSLLMDKPLILAVVPGVKVPVSLARAADEIVEVDFDNPGDSAPRIDAAYRRALRARSIDPGDGGALDDPQTWMG